MAERKELVIPQIYKDKYGEKFPIWSYSKVSGIRACVWEYYLGRIKKMKGDSNIYSILGTSAHDILEGLYNDEIKYENMVDKFESDYLEVQMSDYKFSNDDERHEKMAEEYHDDICDFFQTHKVIPHKVLTERLVWIDVNGNVFLGYVDGMFKDSEGFYHIVDWKTSTLYKGEQVYEHQKQLLLYALSLNQLGIPIDKIKICWNFLKYTNVNFAHMISVTYTETTPKETKEKTTTCLRSEWVSKVKTQLKKDIISNYEKHGLEVPKAKDLKAMIDECIDTNSLSTLPKEVQDLYVLSDVVRTARRHRWVKESPIQTQIRKDLKLAGVDDIDIEMKLVDCAEVNSLEPVKELIDITTYQLNDAYVYGVINEDTIADLISELCNDINLINSKSKDNEDDWEREPITEADSFYCTVLCGHKKNCKYYKQYREDKTRYTAEDTGLDTQDLLAELNDL